MQVKSTRDYNLFTYLTGNRKPNKAHVRKLQEAISDNAKLSPYRPILVNEDMAIIDGQHRFEALKNLDLPVHYVVAEGTGLKEVQELNSIAKVWTPVEYAKSFADLGHDVYEFYLEMKRTYGLNHDVLLNFISLDEPMTGTMFQAGGLVAPDRDKSHRLARQLTEVGEYYPRYKIRTFARAYYAVANTKGYDHARMIAKMKAKGDTIKNVALREEYIKELEKVYNYHAPMGNRMRFDYN